jgi:FkbM family methyltransferase
MIYEFEYDEKPYKLHVENKHIEGGMVNKGEWFYEQKMLTWIKRHYPKGGIILDVGAYIGTHTVFFRKIMGAEVHAFEPVPEHRAFIEENLALNNIKDGVILYPFGLSDREDVLKYRLDVPRTNPASVTLLEEEGEEAEVRTLDSLNIKNPTIIKIDVEDMEIMVLKGGEKTIKEYKPDLFIEAVALLPEIDDLLGKWGYLRLEKFNATPTYRYKYAL